MVTFMCRLGRAARCSGVRSRLVWAMPVTTFLEEADVSIGRWSKAECPPCVVGPVQPDEKTGFL